MNNKLRMQIEDLISMGHQDFEKLDNNHLDNLISTLLENDSDHEIILSGAANHWYGKMIAHPMNEEFRNEFLECVVESNRDHFYGTLSHLFSEVKDDMESDSKWFNGLIPYQDDVNGETLWM